MTRSEKVVSATAFAKVPAVTLGFWIIKILATTLGETGGDTVTMTWLGETTPEAAETSMNGYLVGSAIFGVALVLLVWVQIRAQRFNPWLYWATIVASTTCGTTLADFADRSLGVGYAGGSLFLLACVILALFAWYRTLGTIAVDSVTAPRAEIFYWITITFSQTLGTALGDWAADGGLGYAGGGWRVAVRGMPPRAGDAFFPNRDEPCHVILGGVHPDPAAWRHHRRFLRQANQRRRPGDQPSDRLAHPGGRNSSADCGSAAARRQTSGRGRFVVRRPTRVILAAVLLASVALPAPALAGPPFVTDDPEPTENGHWEIYAPLVEGAGRGRDYEGSFGAELNYGAAKNVQLTLGVPASFAHDRAGGRVGGGDLEASVKYRFYHNEASGFQIAAFPGITIPTARQGLGNPRPTALLPVWLQKDVGSWSVFGGGGYAINPGPGNRSFWTGGVAITRELSKRVLIGVEADRQGPDTNGGRAATSLGLGGIIKLGGPFRLLASGGPTLTDGQRRAGLHGFVALGIDF